MDWSSVLERTQLHMNLMDPFIAFRRVLLQIMGCNERSLQHLLQSSSTLGKGSKFSQAAAALHEFKLLCAATSQQHLSSYWLGRVQKTHSFLLVIFNLFLCHLLYFTCFFAPKT